MPANLPLLPSAPLDMRSPSLALPATDLVMPVPPIFLVIPTALLALVSVVPVVSPTFLVMPGLDPGTPFATGRTCGSSGCGVRPGLDGRVRPGRDDAEVGRADGGLGHDDRATGFADVGPGHADGGVGHDEKVAVGARATVP
jgi:hypothetical protein